MNAPTADPRERLVQVGNELLDVLYEQDALRGFMDQMKSVEAMKKSPEQDAAIRDLMDESGMDSMMKALTLASKRDSLVREYVTIRRTIEALLGSNPGGGGPMNPDSAIARHLREPDPMARPAGRAAGASVVSLPDIAEPTATMRGHLARAAQRAGAAASRTARRIWGPASEVNLRDANDMRPEDYTEAAERAAARERCAAVDTDCALLTAVLTPAGPGRWVA